MLRWTVRLVLVTQVYSSIRALSSYHIFLNLTSPFSKSFSSSFRASYQSVHQSTVEMKREGRQHGMVRTYRILPPPLNPRPESRLVNSFTSPPTAGIFTKVPSKPTNHSKFTGKCGISRCIGCHMHPTTKSKVKTKGATKLRSNDFTSASYKLLTWRAMNGPRPIMNLSGVSATGILDFMMDDSYVDDCEDKEKDDQIMKSEERDDGGDNSDKEASGPHDYDESMSFYDVEMMMMMDHVVDDAEDDWCLV